MKIITYLGFTVLSIFIQFCVMDYIQDKPQLDSKSHINNSHKKELSDLIKDISSKPHALYYKTNMTSSLKKTNRMLANVSTKIHNDSPNPEVTLSPTDISYSGSILDVLYDENTSVTETSYSTEPYTTMGPEFDNVTEITLIEKNKTSEVLNDKPKPVFNKDCSCNFLHQVCDINCCCDKDCTDYEHKMFKCGDRKDTKQLNSNCLSQDQDHTYSNNLFDNLFCVAKTNLPDKRIVKKYQMIRLPAHLYKWIDVDIVKKSYDFKKTLYTQGDPIWLLNSKTFYYLDIATPLVNSYCNVRSAMKFLKEESIKCKVRLKELEMFYILRVSEEARIISATDKTFNSSVLNCSNLHCINWTVLACDNRMCIDYNKNSNEVSCTESMCTNIALKIDYIFYYYDTKIVNATIKLYTQNVSNILPVMEQEINVRFFMANKSEEQIIQFSGSPGYVVGRPLIVSYSESNYTDYFYNSTSNEKNLLIFPENKNGICLALNVSNNAVMFGLNKRMKCRYLYTNLIKNNTNVCNDIQKNINELIGFDNKAKLSPLGNPYGLKDEDWIDFQIKLNPEHSVKGEYNEDFSKLYCRNLVTRISLIFMIGNTYEDFTQKKILLGKYDYVVRNVSFNLDAISTVITIDINFVDVSKPNSIEYAGSPNLNIHLPKNFFFPFPSNKSNCISNSRFVSLIVLSLLMLCNNCSYFEIK